MRQPLDFKFFEKSKAKKINEKRQNEFNLKKKKKKEFLMTLTHIRKRKLNFNPDLF